MPFQPFVKEKLKKIDTLSHSEYLWADILPSNAHFVISGGYYYFKNEMKLNTSVLCDDL